jgi:hypothetical protein
MFVLKYINIWYYFMQEYLNFCIPTVHTIEVHYNSSFIHANSISAVSPGTKPQHKTRVYCNCS